MISWYQLTAKKSGVSQAKGKTITRRTYARKPQAEGGGPGKGCRPPAESATRCLTPRAGATGGKLARTHGGSPRRGWAARRTRRLGARRGGGDPSTSSIRARDGATKRKRQQGETGKEGRRTRAITIRANMVLNMPYENDASWSSVYSSKIARKSQIVRGAASWSWISSDVVGAGSSQPRRSDSREKVN